MLFYLIKRLGVAAITVVIAVSLLYSMIHAVPGDPLSIVLGPRATPEMKAALNERLGLDKPFAVQLGKFFINVAQGDLGTDVFSDRSVSEIFFSQLPFTASLVFFAIGWSALIGIPLGCYSAVRRNTFIDKLTGLFSVGTITIPSFVVALYSLLVFAVWLKWLPAIGAGKDGDIVDQLIHLILPSFAVGLGWVGYLARLVRASMLEVLGENHIRTARAFGLTERKIVLTYALRLAVLPAVALLGVGIGYMLSGAVFAEIVFARPGVGKLIYDSVITRNYPVVMGSVIMTTIIFVFSTTAADLVSAFLDPRIRENL
ncbi:ABC transporter permease [Desulfospira joergensenii]|uniref:ABC transporter permease n=1 Tax=Desulfospira joergensenii TaxID=53329 RepID=UPI0003B49BA6|nr:ABC transporter permease [Desulfospira joergensenii]